MSRIEPRTLKGFRDFLPAEARKRQYVIDKLRSVFESYGFEPLESPALEYEEILSGKYGDEGERLMYKFEDNGGRKVALRYDQTVPLARVVAQYSNSLPLPFKRYQIQNVWRAENTQKGRFREFLQCDIDTVGTASPFADAEIIACVLECMEKLGFKDYELLINDRRIFEHLSTEFIRILDKMDKIGELEVLKILGQIVQDDAKAQEMYDSLKNAKPTENIIAVESLLESISKDFKDKLFFMPWLARGLDYYTGVIFELRVKGSEKLSIGGGGRYDNLIGIFSNQTVPAVGFAFGFDRLIDAMEKQNLFPDELSMTKVLVTVFSEELSEKSIEVTSALRSKGINTEVYLDAKTKMDKQLKYADQKRIPYVVIIGPKEAESGSATIKNMKTGEQKTLKLEDLPNAIS